MLKTIIGGLALFLAVSAFGVPALAVPRMSPAAGSDQILAARSLLASEALVFNFTQTVKSNGKLVSTQTGTVTLGSDFNVIEQGQEHTLDDFTLCRVLTWKTAQPKLDNQSCFFGPAFRLAELYNRQGLHRMLAAAVDNKTKKPENLEPYWAEQELAVQDKPSDTLTVHTTSSSTDYRLDDRVVVRTSLTVYPFSPAERQRIARYLARHMDLHPQVLRAILASGQLPSDITIERYNADQAETETFHFTALSRQTLEYPLPPGLISALTVEAKGESLKARGLNKAFASVTETELSPKPDFDMLMERLEAATKAHQGMTATLLFQELATQYGGSMMSDPERIGRLRAIMPSLQLIFAETDSAQFMLASQLAGDGKATPQNEAAARYLANAKELDALPFGTFRYVTFANLVRVSGDTSAWDKTTFSAMPSLADCYWIHIAAYPWIGNSYKDLGDLAYQNYEMDKAWQMWDLGRAVDSDWQSNTLKSIEEYEDRLRVALPTSF
ncbi:hypothetical protein [Asticcacaulis sp. 201]|uniref:hypothetical protein n=1 Tax=Asticcacaulis sp. 201 TaxID=3028787 RepID=UPI002916A6C9|nr:hypothetical protein [Asticcacaulis sp. 201]MDV6330125.1 hypothetical protein [Asticcacaulis sp. 201]